MFGLDVGDPPLEQCRQPGLIAVLSIEAQGLLDRRSRLSGAGTRLFTRLMVRVCDTRGLVMVV